ncbi:MAG: hypothetical protein ACKVOK_09555 [Flavobacteriales bacterium]
MKRSLTILSFFAGIQLVCAQSHEADSQKAALAQYKNPMERFTATIKYLESVDAYGSNTIDSALCVDLLQMAQSLKNDSLLAISYNWIGYYFATEKGDNTTAFEYYFKAIPLAEKYKDKRRISSLYFDIAGRYFSLENFDELYAYTKLGGQNLPDKTSPKYDHMLVQYQRNLGVYFLEKGQVDSALYYVQAASQTSERLKTRIFKFQLQALLATAYARMHETDLANVYWKKAQSMADSADNRKGIFYNRYIPFLIDSDRLDEAREEAEKYWNFAQKGENLNSILMAATFKKQLFDKLNQVDSAYYYSKVESQMRASIYDQDNLNAMQAMAFKEQLRVMEEAAKKADEEQRRKVNLQFALIGFGIITFIIIFLLLSRSIITNTRLISFLGVVALLIVFEFLNLLLHPFLERITHHNPALMLLALVCIAAMLVPLHHRLEKWATAKLVEKNKQIRLAAAKRTVEELEREKNRNAEH